MAKEVKKNEKKKEIKTLGIPVKSIINNIIISQKEAWAYYVISEKPYDFLSTTAKVQMGNNTMTALASLVQSADKKIDCHLKIVNVPFDVDSWEEQMVKMNEVYTRGTTQPFEDFIEEQVQTLKEMEYKKRVTYLGVKLFNRASFDFKSMNILENSFSDSINAVKKAIDGMLKFNAEEITDIEEKRAKEMENEFFRILSNSSFRCVRPTSEELLLTLKYDFYPAMPAPYLETNQDERIETADIIIETGGTIEVKPRWLEITQFLNGEIMKGYHAVVSFSKFPREMIFPSPIPPFLYRQEMLPFSVNCRFTLVPTEEMKGQVNKKKLETDDEIENLKQSNQRPTAALKDTVQDLNTIETDLEQIKMPWIVGSYRLIITAVEEEQLKSMVQFIKQTYAESDTVITWTAGDQLPLFRECMLGGNLEIKSFQQTTNLALLGIAGINYGSKIGDTIHQNRAVTQKRKKEKHEL